MPISFKDIPANLRIPGVYIEFDPSLAGQNSISQKILVMGQMLTAGEASAGELKRITSVEDAERYWGRKSMLAAQFRRLKAANRFIETWGIGLEDDGSAAQASGSIDVTGTATEAGTLSVYIGNYRVRVGVADGDTGDDVATALVTAIGNDDLVPVTAQVNGTTSTQVDLTARHGGEVGNDIDIRVNYNGEQTPAGLSTAITEMTGGTGNPDISTAIASMGDEWWNWIVCPWTDATNLDALESELADRYGPVQHKGGRAFAAFRGTHSETVTFGDGRNSPHVTCMGTGTSPTPTWEWAAVNAAVAGASLARDPARPLQRLALPGVAAPDRENRFTDDERNLLLYDGISTYTVASDGTVQIERQITMYQENSAGVASTAYLDITVPETLERIRFEQRAMFLSKYPRHKLAQDSARVGAGQPVMQPKLARAELLALYRQMEADGWVMDFDGYKESLLVEIDDSDNSQLNVLDQPMLVGAYRIHAQRTQFRT